MRANGASGKGAYALWLVGRPIHLAQHRAQRRNGGSGRCRRRGLALLLPRAAEELKIPFVASGGMGTASQLVAALALGADGINMGTRFIATKEAPVHENVKQALIAASELDTRLIMRPLRNTERVLANEAVEKIVEIEREKGASTTIDDIKDLVGGVYPRVMQKGEMDAGAWSWVKVV